MAFAEVTLTNTNKQDPPQCESATAGETHPGDAQEHSSEAQALLSRPAASAPVPVPDAAAHVAVSISPQPPGGTQPAEDPRARHDAGEPCQALLAASTSSALEVGTDGKLRYKFRPKGVPAGAWPRYPWYVSTFQDPFERINVWSHGLPSLAFLILGILALAGAMPGGHPLGVYGFCAMMTHAASTATHVWPDDRVLEKVDHICISFLIIGVPLTAIMALRPSGPYLVLGIMAGLCVGAAFLKPLYRTLGFVACGTVLFIAYRWIVNWNLVGQVVLQLIGGWFFVRNDGHGRWLGLQDHHILHYCVTAACVLHVIYIEQAVRQRLSDEAQQAVS